MTTASCSHRCSCSLLARLVNGFYYLALGLWFGAMVMLAVSAAVTFKTVRHHQPTLQLAPFDQPEFKGRETPVLAGAIVGNSLKALKVIQILCASVIVVGVLLQNTAFRQYLLGPRCSLANLARLTLIALPIGILVVDILWITPSIYEQRQLMWDLSQSESIRQAAHETFGWYHKLSERVVGGAALSVAAAVVVSSLVLGGRPGHGHGHAGHVERAIGQAAPRKPEAE